MQSSTIDLTADIIDTRDIIDRFEQLEDQLFNGLDSDQLVKNTPEYTKAIVEYKDLQKVLEELCGNGGDEQWRGDWYPTTLIRDSHFIDYAQEMAEDCGMIPANASWPNNCIDWVQAARKLRMDYSCTEINRVSYWYR